MAAFLIPVALFGSGLSAGVLFGGELGIVPYFMAQNPDRYVQVHSFMAGRYDPLQPICLAIAALADIGLAVGGTHPVARVLYSAAALSAVGVAFVSRTHTAPMGKWVKRLDPAALPDDWDATDFRRRWGRWNRTRVTFAMLAFFLNVVATGVLL